MYMDLIQIIMIIFEANWPNVFRQRSMPKMAADYRSCSFKSDEEQFIFNNEKDEWVTSFYKNLYIYLL